MEVDSGGVPIHYEVTGEGRPVVLLHGFPDSGRLWRHQVPALVEAGHQVVVPDLRGYGSSGKPDGVDAYSIPLLAGDVIAVLGALGLDTADVVGHDWGAALAWALGSFAPQYVDRLAVLSVGHPATFRRTLAQKEKSWYMLLFQFRPVAEEWLSANDWQNFRQWAGHPDAEAVIANLEATGSLTPALNWYRANVPPESFLQPAIEFPPVKAPVMGVWSTGDIALTEQQMIDSAENVSGPWRYERLDGPGHWMQLEAPEAVNALLLDFLAVEAYAGDDSRRRCNSWCPATTSVPEGVGLAARPFRVVKVHATDRPTAIDVTDVGQLETCRRAESQGRADEQLRTGFGRGGSDANGASRR